ncbi:MAG: histone deacetylase [Anaerolineaceae bacterium]|nr:histone deacetylase [Anaerolineaceae bacterium]
MTTVYVTHSRYREHHLPGHPEHAGRIQAVWQHLEESGLAARMQRLEPEPLDEEHIRAVHTRDYLTALAWLDDQTHITHLDADTYAGPKAYEIARLSAGGAVGVVDAVLSGEADNGLAAIRPPGHHAMPSHAMGFCLLGNIAIAARYAQRVHQIERVMIVDFDVHHGNGTEAMFYDDDSVLFISTHQYPFYPGTGRIDDKGQSKGKGYTINIPFPGGHGDASYAAAFEQVVWPTAARFEPQLILVSAGFDAHWTDPLASMRLTLTGYAHLTRELIRIAHQFCGGKIVFVMEGGYNLEALGNGVQNIAYALLGEETISDPLGPPRGSRAEPDAQSLLDQIRQIHGL